jgi:hypothetical protein
VARVIAIVGTAVLVVVWIRGSIDTMIVGVIDRQITDVDTPLGQLKGTRADRSPLEHVIVITDAECSQLGSGWKHYAAAAGRFPLGAGQNTDASGTTKTFYTGQDDREGEYVHLLSAEEMPAHTHSQDGSATHSRRCSGDCSSLVGGGSV